MRLKIAVSVGSKSAPGHHFLSDPCRPPGLQALGRCDDFGGMAEASPRFDVPPMADRSGTRLGRAGICPERRVFPPPDPASPRNRPGSPAIRGFKAGRPRPIFGGASKGRTPSPGRPSCGAFPGRRQGRVGNVLRRPFMARPFPHRGRRRRCRRHRRRPPIGAPALAPVAGRRADSRVRGRTGLQPSRSSRPMSPPR